MKKFFFGVLLAIMAIVLSGCNNRIENNNSDRLDPSPTILQEIVLEEIVLEEIVIQEITVVP